MISNQSGHDINLSTSAIVRHSSPDEQLFTATLFPYTAETQRLLPKRSPSAKGPQNATCTK